LINIDCLHVFATSRKFQLAVNPLATILTQKETDSYYHPDNDTMTKGHQILTMVMMMMMLHSTLSYAGTETHES